MGEGVMPMLLLNMGGEMLYILEQRLQAQAVGAEKSARVLQDVVRTMYNTKFIAELFRCQQIYSMQATRQIFDRLAHSSIMRLNESSMDKLFDLMTMGFKYQLLSCRQPQELLLVTLNHLHEVRKMVSDNAAVTQLVDDAIQIVYDKYLSMNAAEFAVLKQSLCRFFSDKKIKVSLFLADGLQRNDGVIVQSCSQLPPSSERPGKIQRLDAAGRVTLSQCFNFPVETFPSGPFELSTCKLGLNLYTKSKPSKSAASADAPPPMPPVPSSTTAKRPRVDSVQAEREILESHGASDATRDLNQLADLIMAGAPPADSFKLNLFPDTSFTGSGGGGNDTIIIEAGGQAQAHSNRALLGIMADMKVDGGAAGANDDLLDLLDRA